MSLWRPVRDFWDGLPVGVQIWLSNQSGRLNRFLRGFLIPISLLGAAVLGMVAVAYIADDRYEELIRTLAAWGVMPGTTGELTPEDVRKIGKYIGGGIGIALIFSTLKSVIDSIEPALEFGKSWGKWPVLIKPFLLTFMTVGGLMLVLVARPWETDAPARTIQLSFETSVSPVITDDGLLRFVVPIASEAGTSAAHQPRDLENLQVAPDKLYKYVLARFATTLRHCVRVETDRVALRVVGFSSSSLWEEVSEEAPTSLSGELAQIRADRRAPDDEAAFNLWVAESRAKNVLQVLEAQLDREIASAPTLRGRFRFEATPWVSYDAMMEGIRINDAVLYDAMKPDDAGFLTRRVDVIVDEAGSCERAIVTRPVG